MCNKLCVVVVVSFLIASCIIGNDTYYYYFDEMIPIEIDSSKLMVSLTGIIPDEAATFLNQTFEEVITVSDYQPRIAGFYLVNISPGYHSDEVEPVLQGHPNINFVNQVGKLGDENYYWGRTFYCKVEVGTPQTTIDSLCNAYGLQLAEIDHEFENVYFIDLSTGNSLSLLSIANVFSQLPFLVYSQPLFHQKIHPDGYQLEDAYFHLHQTHIKRVIGCTATDYGAWEFTRGDTNLIIAVVDHTIEAHEEFPESKMFWGYDLFTREVEFHFPGSGYFDAHGMAVAGLIGAIHNNVVTSVTPDGQVYEQTFSSAAGIAPDAKLMSIRILKNHPITQQVLTVGRVNFKRCGN